MAKSARFMARMSAVISYLGASLSRCNQHDRFCLGKRCHSATRPAVKETRPFLADAEATASGQLLWAKRRRKTRNASIDQLSAEIAVYVRDLD